MVSVDLWWLILERRDHGLGACESAEIRELRGDKVGRMHQRRQPLVRKRRKRGA